MKSGGFKRAPYVRPATPKLQPATLPDNVRPMTPGGGVAVTKTGRLAKLPAPTASDRRWFDALAGFGCAVCRLVYTRPDVPCEIHHVTVSGRRLGHGPGHTVGLCARHHRHGVANDPSVHSVNGLHGGKADFERVHGATDRELAARVAEALASEVRS